MPILASAVGLTLNEQDVRVDNRRVLAYAAALGVTTTEHFDDARPEGITALPQFCVCLEWPLASAVETAANMGLAPNEATAAIHLSQDSVFHAPIRPGDRLRARATLSGVRSTRKGALVTSQTEIIDQRTAAPVVTSRSDAMFVGVRVEGDDRPAEDQARSLWPFRELPGPAGAIRLHVARELPHVYSECARIWNPIHTERRVALDAGLPDIILHGTATWAIAGRELTEYYAGGSPLRLQRLAGRFEAPVIPGEDLSIEHLASDEESGTVFFAVRNHAGEVAINGGVAEFARRDATD